MGMCLSDTVKERIQVLVPLSTVVQSPVCASLVPARPVFHKRMGECLEKQSMGKAARCVCPPKADSRGWFLLLRWFRGALKQVCYVLRVYPESVRGVVDINKGRGIGRNEGAEFQANISVACEGAIVWLR